MEVKEKVWSCNNNSSKSCGFGPNYRYFLLGKYIQQFCVLSGCVR